MEIEKLLEQIVDLQALAAKRGKEYIDASGCKFMVYDWPDRFEWTKTGVDMTFGEKTGHDCPESASTTISIKELEMSQNEWDAYLEKVREETKAKAEEAKRKKEEETIAAKRRQLETLKAELGED